MFRAARSRRKNSRGGGGGEKRGGKENRRDRKPYAPDDFPVYILISFTPIETAAHSYRSKQDVTRRNIHCSLNYVELTNVTRIAHMLHILRDTR